MEQNMYKDIDRLVIKHVEEKGPCTPGEIIDEFSEHDIETKILYELKKLMEKNIISYNVDWSLRKRNDFEPNNFIQEELSEKTENNDYEQDELLEDVKESLTMDKEVFRPKYISDKLTELVEENKLKYDKEENLIRS